MKDDTGHTSGAAPGGPSPRGGSSAGLGTPGSGASNSGTPSPGPTLDQIFRRTAQRKPDALALVDPSDKMRVTGASPLRLTYAQTDRAISAMAQALVQGSLPVGSIVGLQLPNTVDMVIALLGVLRAGCIAALLPQLWRQADLVDGLNRVGARAVIASGMIDTVSHGDLVLNAAVEVFSIRYVGGFGAHLPEGLTPLDAIFTAAEATHPMRAAEDARLPAIITFDTVAEGRRAVPRNHMQITAGGLAVALESGMPQDGAILAAVPLTSFAGLACGLMPWLLSGETLVLHQAFDDAVLRQQMATENCVTAVLPAPVALRLEEAGAFVAADQLAQVVGLWRNPEQVAASAPWPHTRAGFTDVYAFGEAGLFAATRDAEGAVVPVKPGAYTAPRALAGASVVGETLVTPKGTLGLRGPMVPVMAYAPPRPVDQSFTPSVVQDYVDTGYAARKDKATGLLTISAPPSGLINVGGYRFRADDLRQWGQDLGGGAMLTGLPDRLAGHRLAGRAVDNPRARAALTELGLNPLITDAFRDRAGV